MRKIAIVSYGPFVQDRDGLAIGCGPALVSTLNCDSARLFVVSLTVQQKPPFFYRAFAILRKSKRKRIGAVFR